MDNVSKILFVDDEPQNVTKGIVNDTDDQKYS